MIVDRGTGGREGARYRSGEVEDVWHLGALLGQRAGGETLVVEALSRQPEVEQGAGLAAARVRQQPSGASAILCRSVRVRLTRGV